MLIYSLCEDAKALRRLAILSLASAVTIFLLLSNLHHELIKLHYGLLSEVRLLVNLF